MIVRFFFKKFQFSLNKKSYGGIVDQCDSLIYRGSEHMVTDAVCIRGTMTPSNNSVLYEIDSNVKFSLTCDKEGILFAKNPHYGWQYCSVAQTKFLPPSKVRYAREFIGKEIVLNSGGSREKQMNINYEVSSEINGVEEIPIEYQQEHNTVKNSCVWLAACLVIRSYDEDLATILLENYRKDQPKYEWLPFFNNNPAGTVNTLYNYFKWTKECYLAVTRVRVPQEYKTLSMTNYILNVKKEGFIVALLTDASGNASHTVGINLQKQLIYDCEEEFVMKLSKDNLSVSCGPGMIFAHFNLAAELRRLNK